MYNFGVKPFLESLFSWKEIFYSGLKIWCWKNNDDDGNDNKIDNKIWILPKHTFLPPKLTRSNTA